MSIAPHVYVADPLDGADVGERTALPEGALHHLRRVLRLADGARLSLTDGRGFLADATLQGHDAVLAAAAVVTPEPQPRIVLAQALSKGRRAEDAVRVACELGVDRIVPVVAARTQGRPDARAAEALVARWQGVAVAALEQSRGARLAEVATPVDRVVAAAPAQDGVLRLLAVPGGEPLPALPAIAGGPGADLEEVVVAVGPEGGWTPEEVAAASSDGWLPVGLGPTVLRTEHAGPVAVAVVAALLGRWDAATLEPRPSRSPDAL